MLDVTPTQHFTEPPPRYTEATLIKALEEHGIGRPSTYAATISTIVDRGYVRIEERRLHPEEIGEIVTDLLVEHFGEYVDLEFTARMEEELDEVARGERAWVPLLREFFEPLRIRVDEKRKELKRADFTTEATDEVCSLGHPMVIRLGRNGKFLACSTYPDHKETRPLPGEEAPEARGRRRPLPAVRRGRPDDQARQVRRLRGLLALPGLHVHPQGRPAAARPAAVRGRLPQERRRAPGRASRAAHRQRLLGVLELPAAATSPRITSRRAAIHDAHDDGKGAIARRGEAGLCLTCGADGRAARGQPRWACGWPADRRIRRRSSGRRVAAVAVGGAVAHVAAGEPGGGRRAPARRGRGLGRGEPRDRADDAASSGVRA